MFDFAWSEIALIVGVALIAIGPKDLPVAIKAVSGMIKKARRMAGEFQTHVDEMVREADLGEMRETFNDLRRMDIKGQILRAVDNDGGIRKTFSEPLTEFSPPPPPVPVHDVVHDAVPATPETAITDAAAPVGTSPVMQTAATPAPAFIPPRFDPAREAARAPIPPAFIPPAAATAHLAHA